MTGHTIELGASVKDRVSGFAGIITARYEYLNGCERYEVSSADKDGKPESFVFDSQQIEVVAPPAEGLVRQPTPLKRTGGPRGTDPVPR